MREPEIYDIIQTVSWWPARIRLPHYDNHAYLCWHYFTGRLATMEDSYGRQDVVGEYQHEDNDNTLVWVRRDGRVA